MKRARWLSVLLTMALLSSMLPMSAFADEALAEEESISASWSEDTSDLDVGTEYQDVQTVFEEDETIVSDAFLVDDDAAYYDDTVYYDDSAAEFESEDQTEELEMSVFIDDSSDELLFEADTAETMDEAVSDEDTQVDKTALASLFEADTQVDKTALTSLIEAVESLEEKDYTPESWSSLQAALAAAKAVAENEAASQEDVDKAAESLTAAKEALEEAEEFSGYVLMNVPYKNFYQQIVHSSTWDQIDSITSATGKKAAYFWDSSYKGNAEVAYGSGATIYGVSLPVSISEEDYEKLSKGETDADPWYCEPLKEAPAAYYGAVVSEDGTVSFTDGNMTVTELTGATASISDSSKHGDYMITISNDGGILSEADKNSFAVYGAVLRTENGSDYDLYHLENLYYKDFNEIAFSTTSPTNQKGMTAHLDYFGSLEGQTITSIYYYTNAGIYVINTSLDVQKFSGYVLMNIPYDQFYAAEGVTGVDAVTSATLNKPRTATLAGGSYHVNADGSDITGVIYPVYVGDIANVAGFNEITDADSVEITVTNRGQTTTTTYEGKDALFEAPSYSYYKLTEVPSAYKAMIVGEDGSISFGAVTASESTVEGATGNVTMPGSHASVEISLTGTTGIDSSTTVSGVILTDADGNRYGLRHIANIWRGTEIGWNLDELDLAGKTISNIRYITQDAVTDYPVEIAIPDSAYVLMNIPYDEFYAAEGVTGVDAVTSATLNKPRTATLAGGSYHVNADGSDITGVIYPVFVEDIASLADYREITDADSVDITVTNRGQTTTTTYEGKDALFEADSYSYYVLAEKPSIYKTLTVGEDGSLSFGAVSARAGKVEGVTGNVTVPGRHASVEISLTGTTGIDSSTTVSGVILTDADGNQYGLRHIANIWRGTEIGWNQDEFDLLGKTITNIRYITQDAVTDYPVTMVVQNGSLSKAKLTVPESVVYTGEALEPEVEVTLNDSILEVGTDYTVEYTDNKAVGIATATVTGTGNYFGSVSGTFRILFKDVTDPEQFYFDYVYWAADEGITTGYNDGNFKPMGDCNRAAVVTFLWRLSGEPEPATMASFKDMTDNEDFNKAISWAAENGITTGWDDNTFRPWNTCNRAAIATFLWRAAGKPEAEAEATFKDMTDNEDFNKAISWAAENSITTGWDDNTFRPWNTCKRLAIVSFLARYNDLT